MTDAALAMSFRSELRACTACELRDNCKEPVPWYGNFKPKYAVIGEAPGRSEDVAGIPFIGPAGIRLKYLLKKGGIDPEKEVTYLNAASCVVPTTRVLPSSRATVGFKRRYSGEFLTLRTAFGNELTVTPNHPVLTRRGWVAARDLKPGFDLVQDLRREWSSLRVPDVNHPPTTAQELSCSLSQSGVREWMTDAYVNFHGDGGTGDVEVVRADGKLRDGNDAFLEQGEEFPFLSSDDLGLDLGRSRTGRERTFYFLPRSLSATTRSMSGRDHSFDLVLGHIPEPQLERFLEWPQGDSLLSEILPNSGGIDVENGTELLGTLSGQIAFDQLLEIGVSYGSSFVHNFHTSEGWYAANQIITHNCYPGDTIRNPQTPHIDACRKWMRGQIAFIQPTYVITVGTVAFSSVRGNEVWPKLAQLHGKPLFWDGAPPPAKPVCIWPVYHPSAALRSGKYQRLIEDALMDFKDWRVAGEQWPETCYMCGGEAYRYDGWGIQYCERHAQRQGMLWPEDRLTS